MCSGLVDTVQGRLASVRVAYCVLLDGPRITYREGAHQTVRGPNLSLKLVLIRRLGIDFLLQCGMMVPLWHSEIRGQRPVRFSSGLADARIATMRSEAARPRPSKT